MEGSGWENSGVGFSKFLALGLFFCFFSSCRLLEGSGS